MLNSLHNILSILKNEKGKKSKILLSYMKLYLQFIVFHRLLHIPFRHTKLFNNRFFFNDIKTFFFLFEEIFIGRQYHFDSAKKDPVIIDCGSNIGLSIVLFHLYYPDAQIISFEPEPTTFGFLQKNISGLNARSIQLNNAALYDKKGKINFYTSDPKGSLLGASIHTSGHPDVKPIEVPTLLLSDFINGPIDFVKMDIEGAETAVIQELAQTKKLEFISEMCIEYHHHLNENEDNLSGFLRILEENNFGYHFTDTYGAAQASRKSMKQDIIIRAYNKNSHINIAHP